MNTLWITAVNSSGNHKHLLHLTENHIPSSDSINHFNRIKKQFSWFKEKILQKKHSCELQVQLLFSMQVTCHPDDSCMFLSIIFAAASC